MDKQFLKEVADSLREAAELMRLLANGIRSRSSNVNELKEARNYFDCALDYDRQANTIEQHIGQPHQ